MKKINDPILMMLERFLMKKWVLAILSLFIVFFLLLLFIKLLFWLLPVGYEHLPVFIGIPAAALLSFIVVFVAGYLIGLADPWDKPPTPTNDLLRHQRLWQYDKQEIKSRRFYYSVLLWLLCFVIIILSIYLLWPLTGDKEKRKDDGKIDITFLQINDVYEISPLDRGRIGGMARVATIRKELLQQNKNTYTLLAGDFLSPSAIGTIVTDSVKKNTIAGMHMLETLNAVGINLVTFGNHEFDVKPPQLFEAINKSAFDWVSSNVEYYDSAAKSFKKFSKKKNSGTVPIPASRVILFKDEDGTEVRIGIIGLTIETLTNKFEHYEDYYEAAEKAINELEGKCDFIVALTHLDLAMDKVLAQRFPVIKLIIGGHEHINSRDRIGETIITKADANAKTVYIHYLAYNKKNKTLDITSELRVVNDAVQEDAATREVVDRWNHVAHELLEKQRFDPCKIVDSLSDPMDGTEASIRTKETNLGQFVAEAMFEAINGNIKGKPVECAVYNSGSIRIDDMLNGYISQYDIFRVVPYGGQIVVKELTGDSIYFLLEHNKSNKKDGSFLQFGGITKVNDTLCINGKPINRSGSYMVAMNDYLAKGKQSRLEYIGYTAYVTPSSLKKGIENDIRKAIILKFETKNSTTKAWPKNDFKVPCY